MFKTYKELMDSASFKGILRLHEDKRIAPLRAVKFFYNRKTIELPVLNTVIIPEKPANTFIGANYLELIIELGLSFHVKNNRKSAYYRKLSMLDGEKFYAYALHHGYDYGHHGEPTVTGLFIHAKTLEASPETLIECDSQFYADLKKLECRKAFYTGRGANPNPKLCLEQKIRSLSDPELCSWG